MLAYAVAVGLVAVATFVRHFLDPWLGDAQALSLLFGAVALAVWWGGAGPAVLAAVLGYAASDYLFIPPRGVFAVINAQEAVALLTYLISCSAIIGFGAGMRAANQRARRYARELEENHSRLELAERRKDDFLAVLAHELRGPLAPIRTAISLMIPRSPELDTARDIIDRQSRHLMRLVDDLLDVSRIREGRIHLEKQVVSLRTVLDDALVTARPHIESAGHSLKVDIPQERLWVEADPTRLAQVFSNLLNNAARYTRRGGHIWLDARQDGNDVLVTVRDDGIGIPREMLPRIFEMYTQLDRPMERTRGGLGIGLTLVRQFVQLHGGSIQAVSEGPDRGSQFLVRLPMLPAGPMHEFRPEPVISSADRPAPSSAIDVLVVNDSFDPADNVVSSLSAAGFAVHAASVAEASRMGARTRPRAVVLGPARSAIDAIALCRTLRRSSWGTRAVIVGLGRTLEGRDSQVPGLQLDAFAEDAADLVQLIANRCADRETAGPAGSIQ